MFNPKIQSTMNDKIKTEMAIKATEIAGRLLDAAYYLCGSATDSEVYLVKAECAIKAAVSSLRQELKIADDRDLSKSETREGSNLSVGLRILIDAADMMDDFKEYVDNLEVEKQ